MDRDRWSEVQAVFEAALDLEAGARDAHVAAACAGDEALLDEVNSLLAAHARAQDTTFIRRPAAAVGDGPPDDAAGEVFDLGRYRLVRQLGQGGMGSVYLGFRSDDAYQQQVAIKLLRRDLVHDELIRRFARERQILAQLEHPNIARLLDGGTAPDGRPYLVMAYVEGETIDTYCRQHELDLEARLRLFLKVCTAVHFAHQNLVVHRDIKPGNVLVDAQGEPQLLDFGIAKLLDAEEFPMTVAATIPGVRLMTPTYASPEQVRGQEVTTASDVYALGVLLYELLTGVRPFAISGLTSDEAMRHLLELTPYRPSTAVLRGPRGASRSGSRDGTESATVDDRPAASDPVPAPAASAQLGSRWARKLEGDLDTIVLTALAKEPERRFASAEALGRDIDRYLRGMPVSARGDSFAYHASRFVRRNKLPVSISVLAVLGLLVLSLSLLVERRRTVEQRDRATSVSQFMIDLFHGADPGNARGKTITAREVLDHGRDRIDALDGRPVLQADLLVTIGQVYRSIGLLEPAEEALRRALTLRRTRHAGDHAEVATSLEFLGTVLHDYEDAEQAVPLLEEAVAMRRRLHGTEAEAVAEALEFLASTLHKISRYDVARSLYEEAVAISRSSDDVEALARRLNALGTLERDADNFDRGMALAEEALALVEAEGEADSRPITAWLLTNLGSTLHVKGDLTTAESTLRRAESIVRTVFDEPHPQFSHTLHELGFVLERLDRTDARSILEEALDMRRTVYGDEHPRVAETLNRLGYVALGESDLETAEALFAEALEIKRAMLPPDHHETAIAYGDLALVLTRRKENDRARELYEKALAIYRLDSDRHQVDIAIMLDRLALVLDDPDRAVALREEATEMYAAARGDEHPQLGGLTYNLGRSYQRAERHDDARAAFDRALSILVPILGDDHGTIQAIRTAKRSSLGR